LFNVLGFQDPVTETMQGIIDLHNAIFLYIIIIFIFVTYILLSILWDFKISFLFKTSIIEILKIRKFMFETRNISNNTQLEIVWTLIPTVILIAIGIPSFFLLYNMDYINTINCTIKAIGHQWFRSFEYNRGNKSYCFDSNMIYESELFNGQLRLLETDVPMLPVVDMPTRILITSTDVLHSFSIPSMGIKLDAVPGRLNQTFVQAFRPGTFTGQCAELCGVGHATMPITAHVVI
jgi:heme/copper-type cytochrome/quinol oxidase subunit 2